MTDLPHKINYLILCCAAKYRVGLSLIEEIRKEYPQYWNKIGEFDPYFNRRNAVINFFRKIYRDYKHSRQQKLWHNNFIKDAGKE